MLNEDPSRAALYSQSPGELRQRRNLFERKVYFCRLNWV
jgi:hypothetical protein